MGGVRYVTESREGQRRTLLVFIRVSTKLYIYYIEDMISLRKAYTV